MRTIHADLLTAQQAQNKDPYVKMTIDGTDYGTDSGKLISYEWREEPYRESAVIVLGNSDRAFDSINLLGKSFFIGEGYVSAGAVNRYCGDGAGSDSPPTLWVKSQIIISMEGKSICVLECEGAWGKLREQSFTGIAGSFASLVVDEVLVISGSTGTLAQIPVNGTSVAITGKTITTDYTVTAATGVITEVGGNLPDGNYLVTYNYPVRAPYLGLTFISADVIFDLVEDILVAAGFTLNAIGTQDDGITTGFNPVFTANPESFESPAYTIKKLMDMTKSYLRQVEGSAFEVVYPQSADAVQETYYSDQAPYFKEYAERKSLVVPNSIVVFANKNADGSWTDPPMITSAAATDADSIAAYGTVSKYYIEPYLDNQTDADNRASALLTKIKSEALAGRLVLNFMDCRVELFDKEQILDGRGI